MKKLQAILFSVLVLMAISCSKEEAVNNEASIVPRKFKVDIPESVSSDKSKGISAKSGLLSGDDIYQNLRLFIAVGEKSADMVQEIMTAIAVHNINRPMSLSFKSDDDGRIKNLEVVENSDFEGITWQFQLTITDAESEGNADNGVGLQVFWNSNPVKGIAIFKPINTNRVDSMASADFAVRIDYSEAGENGYEQQMIVSVNRTPEVWRNDRFYISNLKMFAGKKGDVVEVYGNSEHPEGYFLDVNKAGFNYAFVASSSISENIAVAEVGLPGNLLNSTSRETLLGTNSIFEIFRSEIAAYYNVPLDNPLINLYLHNAVSPGYFNQNGFVKGGTAPETGNYSPLKTAINNLTPYNPIDVHNLNVNFKINTAK